MQDFKRLQMFSVDVRALDSTCEVVLLPLKSNPKVLVKLLY